MRKIQRARKTFLSMSLSLIITFALLIHVNYAKAEEVGAISPNQLGIDSVILIGGQSATITVSQPLPFDLQIIGIVSIYNKVLTASFSSDMTGPDGIGGLWFISLWGTGGKYGIDFAIGAAPLAGGMSADVDVDPFLSFGLVIAGTTLISPPADVIAADPATYKIRIQGTSSL